MNCFEIDCNSKNIRDLLQSNLTGALSAETCSEKKAAQAAFFIVFLSTSCKMLK